jgi:hypothetical protein
MNIGVTLTAPGGHDAAAGSATLMPQDEAI